MPEINSKALKEVVTVIGTGIKRAEKTVLPSISVAPASNVLTGEAAHGALHVAGDSAGRASLGLSKNVGDNSMTEAFKEPVNASAEELAGFLKGVKTVNGKNVFQDYKGRMEANEAICNILNLEPGSVDAMNMKRLVELAQKGEVNLTALSYIPPQGKLPHEIVSDIDKLYTARANGIEPIDAFVPSVKSIEEGIEKVELGEAFEVRGNKNIYIKTVDKTGNKTSVELSMDKETYFKQFPPVERFASCQKNIGNCYEITALNTVFTDPVERAHLLGMLKQDGNDIIVKYPKGKLEIRFKDGKLPDYVNPEFYTDGANGMKLLQYTHGKELQQDVIDCHINDMKWWYSSEDKDQPMVLANKLKEFTNFVEKNPDNVWMFKSIYGEPLYYSFDRAVQSHVYTGKYNNLATELRSGGFCSEVWEKMGYKNAKPTRDSCVIENTLKNPVLLKKLLVDFAINPNSPPWVPWDKDPQIIRKHAYQFRAITDKDGQITSYRIRNPWGIMETDLSYKLIQSPDLQLCMAEKKVEI